MDCDLNTLFFFFKQKTAYEMRISDWSSDVCSSDLFENAFAAFAVYAFLTPRARRDEVLTFLGGVALMLFGFMYRINAYLVAYQPAIDGYQYFPSAPEFLVTLGVNALELLLYLVFINKFPIFHSPTRRAPHPRKIGKT